LPNGIIFSLVGIYRGEDYKRQLNLIASINKMRYIISVGMGDDREQVRRELRKEGTFFYTDLCAEISGLCRARGRCVSRMKSVFVPALRMKYREILF